MSRIMLYVANPFKRRKLDAKIMETKNAQESRKILQNKKGFQGGCQDMRISTVIQYGFAKKRDCDIIIKNNIKICSLQNGR